MFDVTRFPSVSGNFTGFMPLNNWEADNFDYLSIIYITEITNNIKQIRVLEWRLDNHTHVSYIHDLFVTKLSVIV